MPPLAALGQQLDELDTLHAEAAEVRNHLVMEACDRVAATIIAGLRPNADDARLVQEFIGKRIGQDRYGR